MPSRFRLPAIPSGRLGSSPWWLSCSSCASKIVLLLKASLMTRTCDWHLRHHMRNLSVLRIKMATRKPAVRKSLCTQRPKIVRRACGWLTAKLCWRNAADASGRQLRMSQLELISQQVTALQFSKRWVCYSARPVWSQHVFIKISFSWHLHCMVNPQY